MQGGVKEIRGNKRTKLALCNEREGGRSRDRGGPAHE